MHEPVFFEDLSVGAIFDSVSKTVTETEIIEFGWKYDPQPFHISKPDALASSFGGLIARVFMTAAITFLLICQSNGFHTTSISINATETLPHQTWIKINVFFFFIPSSNLSHFPFYSLFPFSQLVLVFFTPQVTHYLINCAN